MQVPCASPGKAPDRLTPAAAPEMPKDQLRSIGPSGASARIRSMDGRIRPCLGHGWCGQPAPTPGLARIRTWHGRCKPRQRPGSTSGGLGNPRLQNPLTSSRYARSIMIQRSTVTPAGRGRPFPALRNETAMACEVGQMIGQRCREKKIAFLNGWERSRSLRDIAAEERRER